MLVIFGEITIDPAYRDELVAPAVTMQQASQAEPGCHRYVFAADLVRDEVFHISEHWESPDALATHFGSAHMAAFGAAIAGKVRGSSLKKYTASGDGAM